MASPELTAHIGGIVFTCEPRGTHYHLTVRGHGAEGHRPLLGTLTVSPAEWHDLVDSEIGASLLPAESIARTVARRQAGDGEHVPPNTAMMLVLALDRLVGDGDWTDAGEVLDG